MTLRMADGPVANLPPGLDAYAGYVNHSGIGITFPEVVATFPGALHLSIATDGSPAMCADVENGAMSTWTGYDYGYCSVANANALIAQFGRPKRLWTAHYTGTPHICSPKCWPGLVTTADGTQWTDHGNVWDESLLSDEFFQLAPPPPSPPPSPPPEPLMQTELLEFKAGQTDCFQVVAGSLFHCWSQASGQYNEIIIGPYSGVSGWTAVITGPPQPSVIGGSLLVTVEDANGHVWAFGQPVNSAGWGTVRLR